MDVAVDRRLADDPGAGDAVLAQVEVEGRVEDVEPRAHDLDAVDEARVDLHAARVADEDHHRQRAALHRLEDRAGGGGGDGAGELRAGEAHGLEAADAEAAEEAEELVGVLERRPGGDEAVAVDLGVGALGGGVGDRDEGRGREVGRRGAFVGEGGDEGGEGRGRPVDLVDGRAGGVEEEEAGAGAGLGLLAVGVAVLPVAQEEAEVDGADGLAHGAVDLGRREGAAATRSRRRRCG